MNEPQPDALSRLVRHHDSAALVMDFDGVLAAIVDDPKSSSLPGATRTSIKGIAQHLGLVAILSGRPLEFLVERASIPRVRLLGSYGAEQLQDGQRVVHPEVPQWMGAVGSALHSLKIAFPQESGSPEVRGVRLEEKSISVAVHWRQAEDKERAESRVNAVVDELAKSTGLHLQRGKMVIELGPPVRIDKGSAVMALVEGSSLDVIAYAGDDVGDAPAFEAVRHHGGSALLVDHGTETDSKLRQLATEKFDGVVDFAKWLKRLEAGLSSSAATSV